MRGGDSADRDANHAVVEAYAKAWLGGNASEIIGFYHDDFTLHYFGQSPMAGDHVGKAAAVVALAKVQQMVNRKLLAIDDVLGVATAAHLLQLAFELGGGGAGLLLARLL